MDLPRRKIHVSHRKGPLPHLHSPLGCSVLFTETFLCGGCCQQAEEVSEYVCQACVSSYEASATRGAGHEAVEEGLSIFNHFYPFVV